MEVGRVIDANLNRLREGIRVIEDTLRYLHNDKSLTSSCKRLRHFFQDSISAYLNILQYRDVPKDVAKESVPSELNRENICSLMIANFKRAQESARVLEEYTKLFPAFGDTHCFKNIRYELYELEKTYFDIYGQQL